eukprot:2499289-Pleurochrysis_carterae.AAC.1
MRGRAEAVSPTTAVTERACACSRFFSTRSAGAYGVRFPGDGGGGGGSFRFFKSEDELSQLLVDAGFARESVSVRTVGRGCAIVRAVWAEEVEGEAKVAEASAKSEE